MNNVKILLLLAAAGHVLCGSCDCMMAFLPGGRLGANSMKDGAAMRRIFDGAPLGRLMVASLLGCAAMAMELFGYLALARWMADFAPVAARVMTVGAGIFFVVGSAHHVICGTAEWFYVRMGRSDEALAAVADYFKQASPTMIGCYAALLAFAVALLAAVLSGATPLPVWACVFNLLPLYLVQLPFPWPGKGNWAGAVMCLGLAILL